jgi:hypothetical protein
VAKTVKGLRLLSLVEELLGPGTLGLINHQPRLTVHKLFTIKDNILIVRWLRDSHIAGDITRSQSSDLG